MTKSYPVILDFNETLAVLLESTLRCYSAERQQSFFVNFEPHGTVTFTYVDQDELRQMTLKWILNEAGLHCLLPWMHSSAPQFLRLRGIDCYDVFCKSTGRTYWQIDEVMPEKFYDFYENHIYELQKRTFIAPVL